MISDNSEALANQIDTICMNGKNSVGGCLFFLSRFFFFFHIKRETCQIAGTLCYEYDE